MKNTTSNSTSSGYKNSTNKTNNSKTNKQDRYQTYLLSHSNELIHWAILYQTVKGRGILGVVDYRDRFSSKPMYLQGYDLLGFPDNAIKLQQEYYSSGEFYIAFRDSSSNEVTIFNHKIPECPEIIKVEKPAQEVEYDYKAIEDILEECDSLFEQHTYHEGLTILNNLIKTEPMCSAAYVKRGQLLEKLGSTTDAFSDFIKAIYSDPDEWGAYNGIGSLFFNLSKNVIAVSNYKHACELSCFNPESSLPLIDCYRETDDWKLGLTVLENIAYACPEILDLVSTQQQIDWLLKYVQD